MKKDREGGDEVVPPMTVPSKAWPPESAAPAVGQDVHLKATLLLVSTLTVMAGATIAPSLPSMQAHFAGVPNADLWVRLVLTIPALLIALTAPFAGIVIDRWGRKRLLLGAMAAYAAAGSAGLWLDSLAGIVASRAFLGLAVAAVMTSVTALIADYYSGVARARFMGTQAAFMGFGGMIFLLSGGLLADIGWRLPFLVYLLPLGFLPLAARTLVEPERPSAVPLPMGAALREGAPAPGRIKTRGPLPLLAFLYGTAFLGMAGFYLVPVQLPFFLETVLGGSPSGTGVAIGASTLFSSLASLLYARASGKVGMSGSWSSRSGRWARDSSSSPGPPPTPIFSSQ